MKQSFHILALLFFCMTNSVFAQSQGGQLFGGGAQADIVATNQQDRKLFVDTFLDTTEGKGVETLRLVFINLEQEHAGNDPSTYTQAQYRAWFDNEVLPALATYVPYYLNNGVKQLLISLQTPYLGRTTSSTPPVDNIFRAGNESAVTFMIGLWTEIATLYNQYPQVVYQMFSEPLPPSDNKESYSAYQQTFINAVRGATPAIAVDQQPIIAVMPFAGNLDKTKSVKHEYMIGRGALAFNFYGHVQKIWKYTHQGTASATDSDILSWPGCNVVEASSLSRAKKSNAEKKKKLKKQKAKQKKAKKKKNQELKKVKKQKAKLQKMQDDGVTLTSKQLDKLNKLTEKISKLQEKIDKIDDKIEKIKDKISDIGNGGNGSGGDDVDPCTREGMQAGLADIVAFAAQIGWKLIVPEMSVSRHAPNATTYLDDVFSVMDELDIDVHYFNLSEVNDSPWRLDCNTSNAQGTDPVGASCEVGTTSSPRLDIVRTWLGLP